ncbi:MAG TPA: glycosyltransferase family 8 protein [Pedobacter sp.]|nr:glycosyltransferase family 8 protein [Pedobacter sp.]
MENSDHITIVVATDNFYAILLAALIKSIEVNHKSGEHIDLYIIDDGISTTNKGKIAASASPEVFTLHWFTTDQVVPPDFKAPKDRSAFPVTTYLRLFSPYIIPADAGKMIYLDVDMIVLNDISELWHTDLENRLFGAVIDLSETVGSSWGGIPNYKELGLDPAAKYFNAGMMLINPKKWREQDISAKVIKAIVDNIESVNFADQYGLNVVLVNQWKELDKRWNSFSVLHSEDPYLIHFLDIKPIFKSYNTNKVYYGEFYKYLKMTPYKDFKPWSDYKRLFRKALIKGVKLIKSKLP